MCPQRPWGIQITEARSTPFLVGVQRCGGQQPRSCCRCLPWRLTSAPPRSTTCHGCGYVGDTCTRNPTRWFSFKKKSLLLCSFRNVNDQICSNHCTWKKLACARGKIEIKGESDLTCLCPWASKLWDREQETRGEGKLRNDSRTGNGSGFSALPPCTRAPWSTAAEPQGGQSSPAPAHGTAPVPDPHGLAQGALRYTLTTSGAASLLQMLPFTFFGPMAPWSISNILLQSKAPAAKGACGGAKGSSGREVWGSGVHPRCKTGEAPWNRSPSQAPEPGGGGRGGAQGREVRAPFSPKRKASLCCRRTPCRPPLQLLQPPGWVYSPTLR